MGHPLLVVREAELDVMRLVPPIMAGLPVQLLLVQQPTPPMQLTVQVVHQGFERPDLGLVLGMAQLLSLANLLPFPVVNPPLSGAFGFVRIPLPLAVPGIPAVIVPEPAEGQQEPAPGEELRIGYGHGVGRTKRVSCSGIGEPDIDQRLGREAHQSLSRAARAAATRAVVAS